MIFQAKMAGQTVLDILRGGEGVEQQGFRGWKREIIEREKIFGCKFLA